MAAVGDNGGKVSFFNLLHYKDPALNRATGNGFTKRHHLGLCPQNRRMYLEQKNLPYFLLEVEQCWKDYLDVAKSGYQQFHQ